MKLFDLYREDYQSLTAYQAPTAECKGADVEILKTIFSCIDLTSLNVTDSGKSIEDFCKKVLNFREHFGDMPNVAAVCVYPVFASIAAQILSGVDVQRAVVSACFPTSQTFSETKMDETQRAVTFGATEVDIVISIGEFLESKYEFVASEIRAIKSITGSAKLKVILETGALVSAENIWKASLLAMDAGADYIKTSTGKHPVSATPEAAWVMLYAIKAYEMKTGRKVGFKPAGGISTVADALLYAGMVQHVLGNERLNNHLFRIGASRLANNLLTEIERLKGNNKHVNYF
ncbi:MAG: deoxyribose-phosphate aldolase [Cytophagaceae bacterium]|jgi:deoxyribose-phosphate aldolase|nr:deoxyribose-phosphate aldolase [Cytophagaceae bacterium]